MPDKKVIANLEFDVSKASSGLDEINSKLQNLSNNSDKAFKEIGNKFNKAFDFSQNIDFSKFSKELSQVSNLSEKQAQKLVAEEMKNQIKRTTYAQKEAQKRATIDKELQSNLLSGEAKTADKILEIETRKNAQIELKEVALQNKLIAQEDKFQKQKELIDARELNSKSSILNKIESYAQSYLMYQGFNQITSAASDLIDEMVKVESQMVEIDRVLNEDSLNIDNYRDKLIGLAYEYGNSFDNVADVTARLAKAGLNSDEALSMTEKTLLALNTAELDATQATEDLIAVMEQWGLMTGDVKQETEDYAAIIDKVNIVGDNFAITSDDILEALKKTSSGFEIAGASIDETIALITSAQVTSQRGGKAIGTALANITQQLKEAKKVDVAKSLGIDFFTDETKNEYKDITTILGELSAKMVELKNAGKENSKEMQDLLSVFTVFRRNIGASLLGDIAGEESTYNKVLETLKDSYGYSLQENEKYMKTAAAAQQQFNAKLLELKTSVWDNGVEDVFRSFLALSTNIIEGITWMTDTFGSIPVAIGLVTLAFTTLNKQMRLYKTIEQVNADGTKEQVKVLNSFASAIKNYVVGLKNKISGTKAATTATQAQTVAEEAAAEKTSILTIKTIGLQAAYSLGLSLAITAVIGIIDKLVHAEENARKKTEEIIQTNKDEISELDNSIDEIDKLVESYEKLSNVSGPLTSEQQEQLTSSSREMTQYLIKNNEYTAEMAGNYELQLQRLKELRKEEAERKAELALENINQKDNLRGLSKKDISSGIFDNTDRTLRQAGIDTSAVYDEFYGKLSDLTKLDFQSQVEQLQEWKQQLEETGEVGSDAYTWILEKLSELNKQSEELTDIQIEANNALLELAEVNLEDMYDIDSVEDFQKALEEISEMEAPEGWTGSVEDFRAALRAMIEDDFPQYQEAIENTSYQMQSFDEICNGYAETINNLQTQYTALTTAQNELSSSGELTASTFKSLADNNLLQYLEMVNGQLQINDAAFINDANAAKEKAIADLQAQAAAEILNIAQADLNGSLNDGAAAGDASASGSATAANAALQASEAALQGAASWEAYNAAMANQGFNFSGVSQQAQSQINNVISRLNAAKNAINSIQLTAAKAAKSAGGAAKGAGKSAGNAAKDATKTFEEESQKRRKIFENEISEYEDKEKDWVDKYKSLGLLSTDDMKYITKERISRYKQYLDRAKNLQGISEEDRAAMVKEYSKKVQQYELEYFKLLEDKLNEQIDQLKKANEEKIKLIEDEADAQIEALRKVEDENDRIKDKEEYEARRHELIYGDQGIEYWSQRTGREAQQKLIEAKKELEELDDDWEEKVAGWTLEDQIQQIEDARDAQIKAIEDAQETQIQAWKDAYNAQVQLYAQTGQIIYDDSVISAGYLYDAYVQNFVEPFNSSLENTVNTFNAAMVTVTESLAAANNAANQVAKKIQDINSGNAANVDVNSQIQGPKQIPPEVIKAANDIDTRNKLSNTPPKTSMADQFNKAAKSNALFKKNVGKFHGGGMVGSSTEALALLRPNEVVLTPEWSAGINKLINRINKGDDVLGTSSSVSNRIDVSGNLVNLDAKINNRQDADYLAKQIEKILLDKFNIKK